MIKSGIYKITCLATNKFYIGSAIVVKQRWGTHRYYLRANRHGNQHLQNAWNKNGESNFQFEFIEYVEDICKLEEKEQYWMDLTQCYKREIGYNKRKLANSNIGIKQSEETKAKRAKSLIGQKRTDEVKLRLSILAKGRKHTEASKAKMRNRKPSLETKAKFIATMTGRKLSEEHKRKISLAGFGNKSNTGRKLPKEQVEKTAIAHRKFNKWPCKDGSRCKCSECRKKKNANQQYQRSLHYNVEFIMLPSEVIFSNVSTTHNI